MKDLTPKHMQCMLGGCPAMFEFDEKHLLLIGSQIDQSMLPKEVKMRIGKDETAVLVPKDLLPLQIDR